MRSVFCSRVQLLTLSPQSGGIRVRRQTNFPMLFFEFYYFSFFERFFINNNFKYIKSIGWLLFKYTLV